MIGRFLGGLSLSDNGAAFNSVLFRHARTLVRLADEGAKPNAERLAEYTDARRPALEGSLYSAAPVYEDFERAKLSGSLALLREVYGADHATVRKVRAELGR